MTEEYEGIPFKLRLRKDTVWYRVNELEAILKQINDIARRSIQKWIDGYIDDLGYEEIKRLSDV